MRLHALADEALVAVLRYALEAGYGGDHGLVGDPTGIGSSIPVDADGIDDLAMRAVEWRGLVQKDRTRMDPGERLIHDGQVAWLRRRLDEAWRLVEDPGLLALRTEIERVRRTLGYPPRGGTSSLE